MKRKITILTIAFLSSMLMCANAFAAATGRCGDSITWTLDDSGNLTLSGSGEMWNNGYDDSPFKDYEIRKATVKYGITSIGESAFLGCSGLTELTLPNSVTSIGDGAFRGCTGLTELTLPNSVTSIGDCAFYGCSGLTELTLPDSVASIGDFAFSDCSGLEKITVESGNSCYDSRDNCNSIIDTETNTLIVGCKNSVIPNSVTSIGDGAFRGCSGLTELTLPNSITSIGDFAFSLCSGLTELTLPNSLTEIGKYAFRGCSGLTELILPNSVTSIGDFAFLGCRGLTELTLPNGITRIEESAFRGCRGLTELTLPSSVTSIGESAFSGCSGLTELTLPNGVRSIGNYAFSDCSGLEKITVDRGNKRYDSWGNCNSIIETGTNTLIVGCKNSVIPNSVTSIGDGAFRGCSGLTELTLSNSVTSIGDCAFYGCSGLTELILPNSVTSIGNYAFSDCSGLEKITVDRGNKRYDSWGNCNSIIETGTNTLIVGCKNSVIPNSVTSIGDCAFYGCSGLTELILPNSVSSIGDIAFTYCSGLEKITVESGNSCYDSRDNCNSIIDTEFNTLIVGCKNSVIPNSVTSIGYYAFYGCSGLTELTLPDSVASIGDGAFICCSDLSKITSLAEIPPVCGSGVFVRVNKTNCEWIVPEGSVAAYTRAEVWNEFSNIRGFSGVEVTVAGKTRKIVVE